jgi:hypothetical protein
MAVLREHRGEFSFYEESWTRTPFNAARRMLEWIDAWYLHGWNGEMEYPTDSTGEKTTCILELAALDRLSRNRVASGTGRRLLDLTTELSRGINIPLKKLILVDETADWPTSWQRLFEIGRIIVKEKAKACHEFGTKVLVI